MMRGEGPRSAWPLRIEPQIKHCSRVPAGERRRQPSQHAGGRHTPYTSISHWHASHSTKKTSSPCESKSGDPSPSGAPRTSGPRHSVIKRAHVKENRDLGVES
ncbi:hypothetical protein BU25DRAFT_150592 [Macroventuria anomochaeta]|uniref:Uncharacterized protein n=1 Tax=Macroventuria anomochaeta TaxID=301207 RepID=A0ACB6SDK1_9PLEO|nr:uncharacterized protein BU25DRAFT_150592 [Macroventuria anomochaeta]KAF2632391.1 hypothetical protein BU25DRAFT_150592 [Macroventuria anomochaeta]